MSSCNSCFWYSWEYQEYWIVIGRTDAKAEAPILWLLDAKNHPIGKYPDAGKDLKSKREGGGRG